MKGRHSTGRGFVQLVRVFPSLLGTTADLVGEQRRASAHLALRCGMLARSQSYKPEALRSK
jgi:hypothetical protein